MLICPCRASGYSACRMATPAHQDLLAPEEHDAPVRPITAPPFPPATRTSATNPAVRPVRPGRGGGAVRRAGLFIKVFLGDMTIWAVLSGVLAYEVARRGLDPQHAVVGAFAGLLAAIAVSFGLKQIANRIVRLNRSALEISRGDLSKG